MNETSIYLSKKIKLLRKEKGLTQKELAGKMGVDSKMISYYETGKSIPSVDALIKIAGIFNSSIDFLLFDGTQKNSFNGSKKSRNSDISIIGNLKWQIAIIVLIAFSSILTANILIYKLHKKNLQNNSQKIISRIVEKINFKIGNIKYASKIIANDQVLTNFKYDLRKISNKHDLILLNTVKSLFNASIVYIMDENGTVAACTPYDNGKTLTGQNFRFRPYFTDAMNNNPSVYAALGTTTLERGIYYSYPIYRLNSKQPRGVAVIKMGINDIDEIIRNFNGISGVLSPDGVIFVSNKDEWLYKTAIPIEEYRLKKIHNSKQFANRELVRLEPQLVKDEITISGISYYLTKKEIILPGWKAFILEKLSGQYPLIFSIFVSSFIVILTMILIYLNIINQNKKLLETQRDLAEKNLSESEEKYRIVFENTGTATIIYGDNKTITMCNSRFEELSGYPRDEIVGRMKWSDFASKDEISRLEDYHSKRGTSEIVPVEYNFKFINREGGVKDIHVKVGFIPGSRTRVASLLDLDFLKSI